MSLYTVRMSLYKFSSLFRTGSACAKLLAMQECPSTLQECPSTNFPPSFAQAVPVAFSSANVPLTACAKEGGEFGVLALQIDISEI